MAQKNFMDGDIINKGCIGEGAFGSVYLVESERKDYAVKVMDWSTSDDQRTTADNEVKIMKELSHDNVLVYVDSFVQNGLIYIVSEFCAGGDLSHFLDRAQKPVPEDLLTVWLWQMGCGLEYMHLKNPPVLHRDLKPSNIYLTEQGDIRLGDLGIARIMESSSAMAKTFCGTPPYMSPEALEAKPYNERTDIWALGCCVMEMATLKRAYQGSSIYILRNAVNKQREPLPDSYSRPLDDLVSKMLLLNYKERISATDVLDSDLLQASDERFPPPLQILKKRKLLQFLCSNNTAPAAGSGAARDTLQDSMANLSKMLTDEEILSDYRRRTEQRKHGREFGESTFTLVNPGALQTVIHNPNQTPPCKTVRRVPNVPRRKSSTTDDSAWKDITASFRNIMLDSMTSVKPTVPPVVEQQEQPQAERKGSLAINLMAMLRGFLTQSHQPDVLDSVSSSVLSSTTSTSDVKTTIRSVLVDLGLPEDSRELLTQVVIFVILKDSIGRSAQQ